MKQQQLGCRTAHAFLMGALLLATAGSQLAAAQTAKPVLGRYGCTASMYSGGAVQYTPRGSFVITADGKYVYKGMEKPSTGMYTVDANGTLSFKGGYLNGGQATKIDRPNKFFLVFPAIPDHRWTCGLASDK